MAADGSGHAMNDSNQRLPDVTTPLDANEIVARLLKLSKRGKLAGFVPRSDGALFEADAHGIAFDFRLEAFHEGGGLRFVLCPLWKTPSIITIVTLLAAGPGLWLTHSMMLTYFSWYTLSLLWTAAWYEPLTILPVPWVMAKAWKKSRVAAMTHANETIAKVAAELVA